MSSDSTRNITTLCRQIRDISNTIRNNSSNSKSSDIPDVLDITSNLLTSIISIKFSSTNADNKIQKQKEKVDEVINQKEKEFIKKMDKKVEEVGQKVKNLQDQMKKKEIKLSNCLSATQKMHSAEILKVENEHESRIQALRNEFSEEKKKLKEKERIAFSGFEKSLASHLSEMSSGWNAKIQEIDEKIASYQKDLHDLIHNKHQQSQLKNELLMNEDRRMASEHERISIEFKTRKEEANKKIQELTEAYQMMEQSIKNQSQDGQNRLIELETNLLNEQKDLEEKRNQELADETQQIGALTNEAATKKLEIDNQRAIIGVKVREIEKFYEAKISTEEKLTNDEIQEQLKQLELHYNPKIQNLRIAFQEADLKRAQRHEVLRKAALSDVENGENEVSKLNKQNDEERKKYNELLKKEKDDLIQLIKDMNKDLEELKKNKQKLLGEHLTKYDEDEQKHNEEISNLMRQFDDQQKKLAEMERLTLEQRNRRKAEEIARIEQEHQNRMNQILIDIAQKIKMDEERAMNDSINRENIKHTDDIESLQSVLVQIKGRMENLQNKMDDLCKLNNQRIQQILEDEDKTLHEDIQKLKEPEKVVVVEKPNHPENNKESIEELKKRILGETEEVKRRKFMVLKEADQLNQTILDMHDEYEKRLKILENQFINSKEQILKKEKEVEVRKENLTNKIGGQKLQIIKLEEMVLNKTEETNRFQNSFDATKIAFKKETEDFYKTNLNEVQKDPTMYESQLENIRNTLTSQIEELQRLLIESKERTQNTIKLLLVEREHFLSETEEELHLISEEKINQIKEDHLKKVEIMNNELEDATTVHMSKIDEMKKNFNEQFNANQEKFDKIINDLNLERVELNNTLIELNQKIEWLNSVDCPSCMEKKDILREMLKKKEDLKKKLDEMHKIALISENKMKSLFVENDKKKASTSLTLLAPKARIVMPKKTANDSNKLFDSL